MTDAVCYGMLAAVPGWGRAGIKKLIEATGTVQALWRSTPESLAERTGIPVDRFEFVNEKAEWQDRVAGDLDHARAEGIQILCPSDANYPAGAWDLNDPPLLLWVRGRTPLPSKTVAMVGTRAPSMAGSRNARDLAAAWASAGLGVVSGLARGVDAAAHQGALDAGGWTIALLGGGVLTHYPPENRRIHERIAQEGSLISEYGLRVEPQSYHFPERNRLIAALSRAVVVVEAPAKSGALITVDFALELGREVFAVPGDIRLAQAKGSNALIRNGATPVFDPDDLMGHMGWSAQDAGSAFRGAGESEESSDLFPIDRLILAQALESDSVAMEELCARTGKAAAEVLAGISRLEMAGRIRSLAGCRWEAARAVRA